MAVEEFFMTLSYEIVDQLADTLRRPIEYPLRRPHQVERFNAALVRILEGFFEVTLIIENHQQQMKHPDFQVFGEGKRGRFGDHLFDFNHRLAPSLVADVTRDHAKVTSELEALALV